MERASADDPNREASMKADRKRLGAGIGELIDGHLLPQTGHEQPKQGRLNIY
jgi:hypothetical protein